LRDRFDFLREAILRTWDRPNDEHAVAIAHRIMFYYAELVGNRRASDRRYKQRKEAKTVDGHVAREESILSDVTSGEGDNLQKTFLEIARRLAERRDPGCDFGDDKWDARLIDQNHDQVVFHIFCGRRRFDRTYYVPLEEFRSVGMAVAEEIAADESP
jgi:hypothetical protein